MRLVSGFYGELETRYAIAYYQLYYASHTGKSLWWLINNFYELGLLNSGGSYLAAGRFIEKTLSKIFLPGLPYINRGTQNLQEAIELCNNIGHEIGYCYNSRHVSFQRITSKVPNFDFHLMEDLVPYWWCCRSMQDVRQCLMPHLVCNICHSEEVFILQMVLP